MVFYIIKTPMLHAKETQTAKAMGSRSRGEAASVLELRGATYYRDGGRVLSGVDLTVCEGEIVVLVGASGAGGRVASSPLATLLLALLWRR